MLKSGGIAAYVCFGLGLLGVIVGLAAGIVLMFSKRAARRIGIAALVLSAITASVGVLGMQSGLRTTDRALAESTGGIDETTAERVRVEGFREAQLDAKLGIAAAALPFALGAIAAVMGAGASSKWAASVVAVVIAIVPVGGALAASLTSAHAKYPFDPTDRASWELADGREAVEKNKAGACDKFDGALDEAQRANVDPILVVPDWQAVATKCARAIFVDVKAHGGEIARPPKAFDSVPRKWNATTLLDSSLVVDEDLRREITAYAHTTYL